MPKTACVILTRTAGRFDELTATVCPRLAWTQVATGTLASSQIGPPLISGRRADSFPDCST
jgi:hypothetical protein